MAAHVLFRRLLSRDRALAPLDYRFPAASGLPLFVRALLGSEDAGSFDAAQADLAELRSPRVLRHFVAVALCDRQRRQLLTYDQTGQLLETELLALGGAVVDALEAMSPTYWRHDVDAWNRALKRGAGHATNVGTMIQAGHCHDVAGGLTIVTTARPDRFYGRPVVDLTDGQLMAFASARAAFTDLKVK